MRISATLDVGVWVGLLVKGLPGSRSGADPALLESTERVRTEAKRALAPGAGRERLRQRFRGFAFPPGPLGTEADSLPSLGRAGGWDSTNEGGDHGEGNEYL